MTTPLGNLSGQNSQVISIRFLIWLLGETLPGGIPIGKRKGMLVVSFRGVNLGFWSHLGRFGKNADTFSRLACVAGGISRASAFLPAACFCLGREAARTLVRSREKKFTRAH